LQSASASGELAKVKETPLLQLCVLCFGLPVDWSIGIGILPELQEILVRFPCPDLVTHHDLCATELKVCESPVRRVQMRRRDYSISCGTLQPLPCRFSSSGKPAHARKGEPVSPPQTFRTEQPSAGS